MVYREQPDNLKGLPIISVQAVAMIVLQFAALGFSKFLAASDNVGYAVPVANTVFYLSSFFLLLTLGVSIRNKSIGLVDLVLIPAVLIATFVMFN